MKEIIRSIITNVLTALYQPFWFAVLLSITFMFLYLYARSSVSEGGRGYKEAAKTWLRHFKNDPEFRRLFFFVFYITMILFRTLVNRNMWLNPLSDVMGGWWIYKEDSKTGEMVLTTECIENLILFLPFTILLFWNFRKRLLGETVRLGKTFCLSMGIVFLCSLSIEFLQLFLRLGTFQLSDLCYNTLGGGIGGLLYFAGHKLTAKISVP